MSYPLETVSIDFLSLGRHGDTYPYLLVITDLFSKYGWAVPTKDQTAATTAWALWRYLIQPWGCPERILSDQGAAFESTMVAQLCSLYGCAKVRTTPYRPQGNGACERFNKTVLSLLGTLSSEDQVRWPDHLPTLLQMYNNTPDHWTGPTFCHVWPTCPPPSGDGGRCTTIDPKTRLGGLGSSTPPDPTEGLQAGGCKN